MIQGRYGQLLVYKPPTQASPKTVTVSSTVNFFETTFEPGEDWIVVLPSSTDLRGISINGGRHGRIISGEINFEAGTHAETLIRVRETTGSITLEGLRLNGGAKNVDIIDAGGSELTPFANKPDVYILNCRAENIIGSLGTTHADLYQPQRAIGNLYIDKLTGVSLGYQGLFLRPQFPIGSIHLNRVNLGYRDSGITYLLFFSYESEEPVTTTLNEVYVEPRSGQNLVEHAVWPAKGQVNGSGEDIGAATTDGGLTASWPARTLITGHATRGLPHGGDFVKTTDCGIGYVSPGYL